MRRTVERALDKVTREVLQVHPRVERQIIVSPQIVYLLPSGGVMLLRTRHVQRAPGILRMRECTLPMEDIQA